MDVSEEVLDGIRELITIGVGKSAGMLNRLTRAHVTLSVPEVCISNVASEGYMKSALYAMNPEDVSHVILKFSGELTGSFNLIIPHSSALNLVIILTEEEKSPDEMDALRVETLLEVGNIIISSVMSSLSIFLTSRLTFQFPSYQIGKLKSASPVLMTESDVGITAHTRFQVQEKEIEGDIFILLNRESFDHLETCIWSVMEKGL